MVRPAALAIAEPPAAGARFGPVVAAALLLVGVELAVLFGLGSLIDLGGTCGDAGLAVICGVIRVAFLRGIPLAVLSVATALLVPSVRQLARADLRPSGRWLCLHAAGSGLCGLPFAVALLPEGPELVPYAIVAWPIGGVAAGLGLLFSIAPPAAWLRARGLGGLLLVFLGTSTVGLSTIQSATGALWRGEWGGEALASLTLRSVELFLQLVGVGAVTHPAARVIGIDDFQVSVGAPCSGLQGIVLLSVFLVLYGAALRNTISFARFLVVFPAVWFLSWSLNVVRIAVLLLIGRYHSPDLAVGGFHSHAGWLIFLTISIPVATLAHRIPWLRKDRSASPIAARPRSVPRIWADPVALETLPFAAFLGLAVVLATLSETPELFYPARICLVGALLWRFRGLLRTLQWRFDTGAIACGGAIGAFWVLSADEALMPGDIDLELAALPIWASVLWAVFRIAGTVLVVPLVEELFFRGYVLRTLSTGLPAGVLMGIVISSASFGMLHDRWLIAAFAGLIFSLLALSRSGLPGAILAHAAANAIVAAWAVSTGDWGIL